MAIVKVTNPKIDQRNGSFKGRDGEEVEYSTAKQEAVMIVGEFRYPYSVRLEDGQAPYPVGEYELDIDRMIQVNKGAHSLGKFTVLRPLAAAGK